MPNWRIRSDFMKNKKENTSVRFNLFDVIIIILVLAAAFAGFRYFNVKTKSSGNVPEVSYVVELQKKDAEYYDKINKGDDIIDAIKGGYYGKVTDVKREVCTVITESAEKGEFVKTEVPGKYNYYITITGTPTTYSDRKILFASQEVRVGSEIFIKNKNYAGSGYIVDIKINE